MNEFPLAILADAERTMQRITNSMHTVRVDSAIDAGGVEYGFRSTQEMVAFPPPAADVLAGLFSDVRRMSEWIREQHKGVTDD